MTPDYPAKPRRSRAPRPEQRPERPRDTAVEPGRRLFVACDLPVGVAAAVARWQEAELATHEELRIVRTLHVTLCFLGSVSESRVAEAAAALGALALPPLPAGLGESLFLPQRGLKRVVALHVDDPGGALAATQQAVSDALSELRLYTPERRPWLSHLTVARYRRPGHPFPLQNVTIEAFGLPSIILYASLLERGGAVHTPLATFPTSLSERSAPRG